LVEPGGEDITVEGTIKLCEDLGTDPEDVVLLAVAYELKSPRVGEWNRKGWIDGWRSLGCDTIPTMKTTLENLRDKLISDATYFKEVYNYTFEFAKSQGQRSLATETAIAFWALLLPVGLEGNALSHVVTMDELDEDAEGEEDLDGDVEMMQTIEEGWKVDYNDWWFEFLTNKGGKGVSKDTWIMVSMGALI
jgi:DCN1-like protein 1/2